MFEQRRAGFDFHQRQRRAPRLLAELRGAEVGVDVTRIVFAHGEVEQQVFGGKEFEIVDRSVRGFVAARRSDEQHE